MKKLLYTILGLLFGNKESDLPLQPGRKPKILILRYDVIGDMINTTPLFTFIKNRIPGVVIHAAASGKNRCIIENNIYIKRIYIIGGGIFSTLKNLREMRSEKYDFIFSLVFNRTTKAALIANLAGGGKAVKVSIAFAQRNEIYGKLFNVLIPVNRNTTSIAELQVSMAAKAFGWSYSEDDISYMIFLSDKIRQKAAEFMASIKYTEKLIFNISARRRLPFGTNRSIISSILEKFKDIGIIIICSPEDEPEARKLKNCINGRVLIYPPTPDYLEIAGIAELADFFITPDTSIVFLANALEKPVIVLYCREGGSYIKEWMPDKSRYRSISCDRLEDFTLLKPIDIVSSFCELYEEVKGNLN